MPASRMLRPLAAGALFVTWVLGLATSPACAEEETPTAASHADDVVKEATARFEKEYDEGPLDKQVTILRWYGMHRHPTVRKKLERLLEREKNLELKMWAATGLGNQLSDPKNARKALESALKDFKRYGSREDPTDPETIAVNEEEAKVLIACIDGLRQLHPYAPRRHKNDGWDDLEPMIEHMHDDVAIAMFHYIGATKEYRGLPKIQEWFSFYPDGTSWGGASATVDTGTAGNADAKAARAKVMRAMAGRKKKARPGAWEAMQKAVEQVTGVLMENPDQLKAWMDENKQLLDRHGV
ncbi:MAG: hypothetical protein AB7T63_13630 [Planctomycetota bacterium]